MLFVNGYRLIANWLSAIPPFATQNQSINKQIIKQRSEPNGSKKKRRWHTIYCGPVGVYPKHMDILHSFGDVAVENIVMDQDASAWQKRFEEADSKRQKLEDILDAIRSGQVDTILSSESSSQLLRLLDVRLVEENERLVQELSRSNQKFRQIFEQSNDAIIILDTEGNILDANLKTQAMWGYTHTEITTLNIQNLHSPDITEGRKDFFSKFSLNNKNAKKKPDTAYCTPKTAGFILEDQFRRKDDSKFYGEVSVGTMILDGKESILAIIRDTTQRKALETEILRSNKELEKFSHVASHDLKAPLRYVRTYAKLLLEDATDQISKKSMVFLHKINEASSNMEHLLNDLLNFARVGGETLNPVRVNLADVVAEIKIELQDSINAVEGTMNIGNLPVIKADEVQIKQLFQNLLENALKYRREDIKPVVNISAGFLPNVEDSLPKVEDSINKKQISQPSGQNCCQIIIEDNGIGFDEKYASHIFEPFKRLVTSIEYQGTGIGLATVKKILDRHNGTIKVHSKEGEGTTFIVTLPTS